MSSSKASEIENPPVYLPPRRPTSLPHLADSSWTISSSGTAANLPQSPPPFLPPQTPGPSIRQSAGSNISRHSSTQESISRPPSCQEPSSANSIQRVETALQRIPSNRSVKLRIRKGKESIVRPENVESLKNGRPFKPHARTKPPRGPSAVLRQLSLRLVSRPSDDELPSPTFPPAVLMHSHSDSRLAMRRSRPRTHPSSRADARIMAAQLNLEDLGSLSEISPHDCIPRSMPATGPPTPTYLVKPRPSFVRLSSLDNMIQYREEKEEWRRLSRSSSLVRNPQSEQSGDTKDQERAKTIAILDDSANSSIQDEPSTDGTTDEFGAEDEAEEHHGTDAVVVRSKFRHIAMEAGFCFTIAMTQFLAEYLISGFAIELPRLLRHNVNVGAGSTGIFWPASLLSLILSATLFIFARISDMYSGYYVFMGGVAWLAIWTVIPGFNHNIILLDVSRAMQGLAIAAFTPSTFVMVGSIYPEGRRKNIVMGLYAGCAPLGFFSGFAIAGALSLDQPKWYFFIAAGIAAVTFVSAFLSVPADGTDRRRLRLKMDWIGSFLIMAGLILVSYALAVEPYANVLQPEKTTWTYPIVFGPFVSGIVCLGLAVRYEGWCATCPLLPFDFFKPKGVKSFSVACLCFYASYGVWLYNSAQYFQSPTVTTNAGPSGISGDTLAKWYLPTAVGGIVLCLVGGSLMHVIPIMVLLLLSALAWIAAPLLLALAPLPLDYFSFVLPSMLCATVGIDLTFTLSIVYFSAVQPLKYQGLSGAMCSSLVNLAMSFALSISEIVMKKVSSGRIVPDASVNWGYKATFLYAGGSAGVGLIICVLAVRISRSVVRSQKSDDGEAQLSATFSEATLVEDVCEEGNEHEPEQEQRDETR